MPDSQDLSEFYNTQLTPEEESKYREWSEKIKHQNDVYDYDLRGAWKSGAEQADNGHFPDTFKKPNHPTFSNQSQYNGVDGFNGGTWVEENGKTIFIPGPANTHWRKPEELQKYFRDTEPEVELRF